MNCPWNWAFFSKTRHEMAHFTRELRWSLTIYSIHAVQWYSYLQLVFRILLCCYFLLGHSTYICTDTGWRRFYSVSSRLFWRKGSIYIGITGIYILERCIPWSHCQSPYLHKPAVVIVTSFSLWRHSLLSCPRPPYIKIYSIYFYLYACM